MRDTGQPKINHLTFFLASLEGGGIQRATMRLIRELIRRDISITLVVINASGPVREEVPAGCELVDLQSKRTRFALPALLKYLRREQPGYAISSQTHLNVLLIILRALSGYPKLLVVREHNTFNAENIRKWKFSERIRPVLIRLFYPYSSRFVAVSENIALSVKKYVRYKKAIQVVHNGVNIAELRELAGQLLDYPHVKDLTAEKLVISLGRLSYQKNYVALLHAFALLNDSSPVRLIILGEGEERAKLEALRLKLQLGKIVEFPGFLANPYPLLNRADVFVLSSRWEGFSNAVLEALACGVPIVATDCPGGPAELLKGLSFARVVGQDDPQAMADAIRELLNSKVAKESIFTFAEQFNIAGIAQKYLDMLQEM